MPWHGLPAPVEIRRAGGRATVVIHASPAPLVKAIFTMGFLLWGGDLILALRLVGASAGAPRGRPPSRPLATA